MPSGRASLAGLAALAGCTSIEPSNPGSPTPEAGVAWRRDLDGDERWRFEADSALARPVAGRSRAFAASERGTVYAFES